VVANTRQIPNSTTTHKNNGVFLKVMAFTTDVRRDLFAIGQTNTGDLPESRVRLLRGHGLYLSANASLLRALVQHRALRLLPHRLSTVTNELINGWHDAGLLSGFARRKGVTV
tara:strand:- start:54 stop:392 length:339 start_codon:yes stop_codon:yes gene_type:complete